MLIFLLDWRRGLLYHGCCGYVNESGGMQHELLYSYGVFLVGVFIVFVV